MNIKFWKNKKIGIFGAAFIGSYLAEKLLNAGAKLRIVNLSNRNEYNLKNVIGKPNVEFYQCDLRHLGSAEWAVENMDIIFHLAANHGGRGYVDTHQGSTSTNFLLDGAIFRAWHKYAPKAKIVFASSGCVYPNFLQDDTEEIQFLRETDTDGMADADNMYGWAKLMAEKTLQAYYHDFGLKSAICRYFTVYGPRGEENHAIMALIAKAFIKQNPYEVWGDGTQVRNWTYVDDIVEGTILAAEKVDNATPINLGTMERTTVAQAVRLIGKISPNKLNIKYLKNMPVGPVNRVADNALANKLLDWKPKINFAKGLEMTYDWYIRNHDKKEIKQNLNSLLLEK